MKKINWPNTFHFHFEYQKPKKTYYNGLEGFLTIFVQVIRSFLQEIGS